MMTLLNPRIIIMLALAGMLAFTHLASYRAGKASLRAEWTAEKLAASETARLAEKARNLANQKVDHDLQIDKARRAAADRVTADRLREFQAALAEPDNPATSSSAHGTGGLERDLLGKCSTSLAELAQTSDRLEGKVVGLQNYVRKVCLIGAQSK